MWIALVAFVIGCVLGLSVGSWLMCPDDPDEHMSANRRRALLKRARRKTKRRP